MRAVGCIFLALAAGCGFAPQDRFDGQRAGDGIAPWTDLGPVQICLGNEFLGPPDSTPGGVCIPTTVVEGPCLTDADCRSRETCVCGSCTVQYCTVNSDCSGGRLCSFGEQRCDKTCAIDDDCAIGDVCFNNTCRGRCGDTSDCQTGEVCNSQNRCITVPCSDDDGCLAGERCNVERVPRVATEPSVVARTQPEEPRFTMWLEISDAELQQQRAIWRAISADGVHYRVDPAQPVLEDGNAAHAPSVVRGDSGYALYYEQGDGAEIRVATSSDGIEFGTPATAVTGGAGPAAVHAPGAAMLPDGTVAVYYEVGDGASVSLARGSIGDALDIVGTVLTTEDLEDPPDDGIAPQFWVDIEKVRSPSAMTTISASGMPSLRMWFSAFGRESPDALQYGELIPIAPTFSLGYAASSIDAPERLTTWPFNPILDRVVAFLEHRSELGPTVVQVVDDDCKPIGGYLLYYMDAETESSDGPITLNRLSVAGNGSY